MNAIRIHRWGGPDVLVYEEAPDPVPGPGEVRLRVHAAGVNPVDWKVREGYLEGFVDHTLPLIPGWDAAGVIDAVGEGVTKFAPGDAVFADIPVARNGAYADYVTAPETAVALKPATLDFVQAASLPIAALTAWQALFETAGLSAGQRVLIHAAAGGVGVMAVQFAHARGAYVIGTASAHNHAFVRELGADDVIDYATTPFEEVVRDVDVVLDTMGYETQARSWQTLKPGGYLAGIVTTPDPAVAAQYGVGASYVFCRPDGADLAAIGALIDSGQVRTVVSETLPLTEARRAHEQIQSRHTRGKMVLIP